MDRRKGADSVEVPSEDLRVCFVVMQGERVEITFDPTVQCSSDFVGIRGNRP